MAVIYGLVSTRDNEIFYVGQTSRDVRARFLEHYWNPKNLRTPLYNRIKEERQRGFDIYHEILEYCLFHLRARREEYWIGALPRLVNRRSSRLKGWISLSAQEATQVAAIRRSRRGGVPNWYGHIGVTYYPHLDAWQVAIQHWNNFYLLRGDGGPRTMEWMTYTIAFGHERYTGDWYFSDGITAVAARNQERERLNATQPTYSPKYLWPLDLQTLDDDAGEFEDEYVDRRPCPILTPEAEQFLSVTEITNLGFRSSSDSEYLVIEKLD
jgi:hypothetical protein